MKTREKESCITIFNRYLTLAVRININSRVKTLFCLGLAREKIYLLASSCLQAILSLLDLALQLFSKSPERLKFHKAVRDQKSFSLKNYVLITLHDRIRFKWNLNKRRY